MSYYPIIFIPPAIQAQITYYRELNISIQLYYFIFRNKKSHKNYHYGIYPTKNKPPKVNIDPDGLK